MQGLFAGNAAVIAILATIACGGILYVTVYPMLSGEAKAEKRKAAIATTRRRVDGKLIDVADRKKQVVDSLKELDAKQSKKLTLEMRIAQAGLTIDRKQYYVFSAMAALGLALLFLLVTGQVILGPAAGLVVGGFGVPSWTLIFLRNRRMKKFIGELPNAMDIIVRGIKAGLPLGDCMRIIANEGVEPLRTEFRQIMEAQTMGLTLGEAVERMVERVPITEANFFSIVLNIQSKSGGNLSEALGNLSRVLRERKKMRGKVTAMSMEAKASAAIIAALPFVVAILVYLSTPQYIELLYITSTGKLVMGASLFWMFLGLMTMRKMIQFDI